MRTIQLPDEIIEFRGRPFPTHAAHLNRVGTLTPAGAAALAATRQQEKEDKGDDFYAVERWAGAFSRSIALPQGVDPDRVEASFKNGVLEIRVPKTKEASGKKIDIKAA